jgi:murein L,D-transpeptidase YafK
MKAAIRFALLFFLNVSFPAICVEINAEKPADRVLIEKKMRRLTLLRNNSVIHTYRVALGTRPDGAKRCEGDLRTPEGLYVIDARKTNSQFHRSIRISYPNSADRAAARKLGCNPGGDIYIHGLPNGQSWIGARHVARDWTWGCIAVTDQEIEEIWRLAPNGTPVEIRP